MCTYCLYTFIKLNVIHLKYKKKKYPMRHFLDEQNQVPLVLFYYYVV